MRRVRQKQVHPAASALFIMLALGGVQWVWWRFLVYREPPTRRAGQLPSPPMNRTAYINLLGRADVQVVTIAGGRMPGISDGPGHAARFDRPTALALDAAGSLYIADTGNHRIRRMTPEGDVTTVAGGEAGFANGPVEQARFNSPCGICIGPDQSIYVADTGNHAIRRIRNGQVSTITGRPSSPVASSTPASSAGLFTGIAFVPGLKPGLLVADTSAGKLLQLGEDGGAMGQRSIAGRPLGVSATPPAAALVDSGALDLGTRVLKNIPINSDSTLTAEQTRQLSLRHPVGLCRLGDGWLVTDKDFGAVLFVTNGTASVIAGYCSSAGPIRGDRDGTGTSCLMGSMTGLVSDGKRYAYAADTSNNLIRRLDISVLTAH